jgi:hypothetical protein
MKLKQKSTFISLFSVAVAIFSIAFIAVPSASAAPTDARTTAYVAACMKQAGAKQADCQTEANNVLNACADNQDQAGAASVEDCMSTATKNLTTKTTACQGATDQAACSQAVGNCITNNPTDTAKQQACITAAKNSASGSNTQQPGGSNSSTVSGNGGKCGGATTVILDCGGKSGEDAIGDLLKQFVLLLSLGVGIVATGAIIYGAILYSSARDNASQTQQAIGVIRNAVIGIILYIFMVAIVNWLVPGGVFT